MISNAEKNRSNLIDILRGFTILLMIFFHGSFDLNYFKIINIDILHSPFWYFLPRLIVFLFFFAVGMSLKLAHEQFINWPAFLKREKKLLIASAIISLVTRILFPENWIYFGTLHCIALISFIGLAFIHRTSFALFIGICLFIPSIFWDINVPFFELPIQSFDYISPFPWMGAMFFGMHAAEKNLHKFYIKRAKLTNFLQKLGKHSFAIYLLHQPILFSLVYLFSRIKN